jgi:hypothetical protein
MNPSTTLDGRENCAVETLPKSGMLLKESYVRETTYKAARPQKIRRNSRVPLKRHGETGKRSIKAGP